MFPTRWRYSPTGRRSFCRRVDWFFVLSILLSEVVPAFVVVALGTSRVSQHTISREETDGNWNRQMVQR
jgi:hypothetical protein